MNKTAYPILCLTLCWLCLQSSLAGQGTGFGPPPTYRPPSGYTPQSGSQPPLGNLQQYGQQNAGSNTNNTGTTPYVPPIGSIQSQVPTFNQPQPPSYANPNYSAAQVPVPAPVADPVFQQPYQSPLGAPVVGGGVAPEASFGVPGSEFFPGVPPGAAVDPLAQVQPIGPRIRRGELIATGTPGRTGRIMLGGSVNSDAGLTGQITVDERNFDILRFPRSFQDLISGTAFRGAGQTFRVEAAPGTNFKRYTASFANPNLFGYLPFSLSVSGFLFDRRYDHWQEERLGGRFALGYRVTPSLSLSAGVSGQNVNVELRNSAVTTALLNESLGDNELYSGEFRLIHDTRNRAIQASEGHYFEFRYEEVFGTNDYSRFETEFRQYFLLSERADGTGRQTLSVSTRLGISGDNTPIFENYFAGGYSTMRGFDFRGANPFAVNGVEEGGRFQWLNTIEYTFPITADDAFAGVAFVDFGTVERDIEINSDSFRVAPGLGLRVAIPMLGPAPLAFDYAIPVARADGDVDRRFSFYMSLIR